MTATQISTAQTITLDFEDEMISTRKLLALVPLESLRTYKPHPKSMQLSYLATHVAELPSWAKLALETEVFELPIDFKPPEATSTAELLAMFDKAVEEGRAALAAATETDMQKTWSFKYGGVVVYSDRRPKVIRGFLNHLVHHRAQLGVYLRLNNIPIPGMYGPSADDAK